MVIFRPRPVVCVELSGLGWGSEGVGCAMEIDVLVAVTLIEVLTDPEHNSNCKILPGGKTSPGRVAFKWGGFKRLKIF